MKKKSIGIVSAVIVLLLIAGIAAVSLINNKSDSLKTGNLADVDWYSETGKEFTITTAQELYDLATLSDFYNFEGQTIKLGADIVVNEGNAEDWAENAPENKWYPISNFAGTFDGQGHTISGLYGKGRDLSLSLFSSTRTDAVIRDFKLVNTYFEGWGSGGTAAIMSNGGGTFEKIYTDAIIYVDGNYAAGFTSRIQSKTNISECWFDGHVTVLNRTVGGFIDGSILAAVYLDHCLFSGEVVSTYADAGAKAGGFCGALEKSGCNLYMTDSLSSGKVTTANRYYAGSVLGVGKAQSIIQFSNVYGSLDTYDLCIGRSGNAGTFTGAALEINQAELIGKQAYQWTGLDFDNYWTIVEDGTPILKYFAEETVSLEGVAKRYDTKWYDENASEYTISTLEELYGLYVISASTDFKGKTVKLGADIVVNEGNAADWAKEAPANPWYSIKTFAGTFDGQGYSISGLYTKNAIEKGGGLFAETTKDATVKNLKIMNCYLEHTGTETARLASVAGLGNGTFENIYSNAILVSSGSANGGIVGQINAVADNKISNCWYDGEMFLKTNTGRYGAGIVANVVRGRNIIEHCLNTATIHVEAVDTGLHVGGLVAAVMNENTFLTLDDCLNAGKLDSKYDVCIGSVIGRIAGLPVVTIKNTYAVEETYISETAGFRAIGNNSATPKSGAVVNFPEAMLKGVGAYQWTTLNFEKFWAAQKNDTPILSQFATGKLSTAGVAKKHDVSWYKEDAKVYTLTSKEDLYGFYLMSASTDFAGKTVRLGANIKVNTGNAADWAKNAPANQWYPINTFAGTFDGRGYEISGIYLKTDKQYVGLFTKVTTDGTIKNLKLTNSYFKTTVKEGDFVGMGSVVGQLGGTMDTVYSNAIIETDGATQIGGLVGRANDSGLAKYTMRNCWFDGIINASTEIMGQLYLGGIVGNVVQGTLNMSNCLNSGTLTYLYDDYPTNADGSKWYRAASMGGLVGGMMNNTQYNEDGTIKRVSVTNITDCMNTGLVHSGLRDGSRTANGMGAIFGWPGSATVNMTNVYATNESCVRAFHKNETAPVNGNVISVPEEMISGLGGYKFTTLDFGKYWAAVVNPDETPILKSFASNVPNLTGVARMIDTSWYKEDATTYILDSVADLYGFYLVSAKDTFNGKIVKLGADIVINKGEAATWATNAPENAWTPIYNFSGTFDGQGHTISGLYIDSTSRQVGFFGSIGPKAVVKNFSLKNSFIRSMEGAYTQVGSIAGLSNGTIDTVYSDAIVECDGNYAGGLVGRTGTGTTIKNCWYDGTLTMHDRYAGGILGTAGDGTIVIENCLNSGTIISTITTNKYPHIGGIVGGTETPGTHLAISNCLNTGKIDIQGITADKNSAVGAVVGRWGADTIGTVTNCYYTSDSFLVGTTSNTGGKDKETGAILNDSFFVSVSKDYLLGTGACRVTTLDFDKYWSAIQDKTPELKSFSEGMSLEGVVCADTSWYDESKDTYYIADVADLYGFSQLSMTTDFAGKTIKVQNDIAVNGGTPSADMGWMSVGSKKAFAGTFDGQMHTISGIYIDSGAAMTGLFAQTGKDSMICNLKLKNSIVKSANTYTGSIVGFCAGNIDTVYSNATVTSTNEETGGIVGRFGSNYEATINNVWFDGTVTGTRYTGGIVGIVHMGTKTMKNCLNTGSVTTTWTTTNFPHIGGIVGQVLKNGSGTCLIAENILNTGSITSPVTGDANTVGSVIARFGDGTTGSVKNAYGTTESFRIAITTNSQGKDKDTNATINASAFVMMAEGLYEGLNGYRLTNLDFENYWVAVDGKAPELKSFSSETALATEGVMKADTSWYNDKDSKFVIDTAEELYGFTILSQNNQFVNKTIELGADIVMNADMTNPKNEWVPISSGSMNFQGTFDGKMHTISGIYVNTDAQNAGLFGNCGVNATIKNLSLKDSVIQNTCTSASAYVGSISGTFGGDMLNVYSDAKVSATMNEVGGLIGRLTGTDPSTISNCWFDGTVAGGIDVGGIIGLVFLGQNKMDNCLNTGAITSTATADGLSYAGGLIGRLWSNMNATTYPVSMEMDSCVSAGIVTAATGDGVGAVIGRARKPVTFTNVYAINNVTNVNGTVLTQNTVPGVGNHSTNSNTLTGAPVIKTASQLTGAQARYNTALDFEGVWVARNGKVPALKLFVNEADWFTADEAIVADTSWYTEDTSATEYTIYTASELYGLAKILTDKTTNFGGKTIKLGADITVNSGDAKTWGTTAPKNNWTPIGHASCQFNTIFDGQGHSISGVYLKASGSNLGLFGVTTYNARIKNLRVVNSYFESTTSGAVNNIGSIVGNGAPYFENVYSNAIIKSAGNNTGGIIGWLTSNTEHNLTNCWFDGTITTAGDNTGGLIGNLVQGSTTIKNCLFTGTVEATVKAPAPDSLSRTGGMVGQLQGNAGTVIFEDCLNLGTVKGQNGSSIGSVIGRVRKAITMTDVYTSDNVVVPTGETLYSTVTGVGRFSIAPTGTPTKVTENTVKGNDAKTALSGFDFTNAWVTVIANHPVPTVFEDLVVIPADVIVPDTSWYDSNPNATEYTLTTPAQLLGLAEVSQTENFQGQTIKLGADITINTGSATNWATNAPINEWTPIGNINNAFAGTFDGQGHTISGIYLDTTVTYTGFISATTSPAVVKNFRLVNSYFNFNGTDTLSRMGSIAGRGNGTFDTIYSDAIVTATGKQATGGMIGMVTEGTTNVVNNCQFAGTLSYHQFGGGVVGFVTNPNTELTMSNCLSSGIINCTLNNVGGLCGTLGDADNRNSKLIMTGCVNTSEITTGSAHVTGSILGRVRTGTTAILTNVYTTHNIKQSNGSAVNSQAGFIGVGNNSTGTIQGATTQITSSTTYELDATYWTIVPNGTPILKSFAQ